MGHLTLMGFLTLFELHKTDGVLYIQCHVEKTFFVFSLTFKMLKRMLCV